MKLLRLSSIIIMMVLNTQDDLFEPGYLFGGSADANIRDLNTDGDNDTETNEEIDSARTVKIEYSIDIVTESMTNITGGLKQGTVFNGLVQTGMDISLGTSLIRGNILLLSGENPSEYIGDGFGASNLYGYNSLRLYEIWFEQRFLKNKWSIRIGSLLADTEFSVNDLGGLFFNSAFGWPAYISGNTLNTGPAFFVTAPGIRIRYRTDNHSTWQAGIYDGDPFDHLEGNGKTTAHGIHWELSNDQGIFSIGEYGKALGNNDAGNVKIGFWNYSNWGMDENNSTSGVYFSSQFLWSLLQNQKEIGVFLRGGISTSGNTHLYYKMAVDGGIQLINPFPWLNNDIIGVGLAYANIADGQLHYLTENNKYIFMDYEMAIEASLQFKIFPWLLVQPDFQMIFHPGGSSLVENSTVMSIRFIISI
jgi:porin